jgi:D-alanyl-D-alanine carboxypeptidase
MTNGGRDSTDGKASRRKVGAVGPELQRMLDRAVSEGGVPGIVVVVNDMRNGAASRFGTAGVADRDAGGARLPGHQFRIGSITKTFVATVMLQLVAERMVDLDDSIDAWLPGVVDGDGYDSCAITIRQLLDHTSGIFNYIDDYGSLDLGTTYVPEQLVGLAMSHPPMFQPGADWAYSNTNYILAGMIIEQATGGTLAAEIARRIADPLSLADTYLPVGGDPVIRSAHSRHYTRFMVPDADAPIHDITSLDMSMFWAAGGMVSTPGDLNDFFAALLAGQLITVAEQREMFTTVETKNWIAHTRYGLGLSSIALPGGATLWGMVGTMFGSQTATYGSRNGQHLMTININGDWVAGPWEDPSGIFADLLAIEFSTNGA